MRTRYKHKRKPWYTHHIQLVTIADHAKGLGISSPLDVATYVFSLLFWIYNIK